MHLLQVQRDRDLLVPGRDWRQTSPVGYGGGGYHGAFDPNRQLELNSKRVHLHVGDVFAFTLAKTRTEALAPFVLTTHLDLTFVHWQVVALPTLAQRFREIEPGVGPLRAGEWTFDPYVALNDWPPITLDLPVTLRL